MSRRQIALAIARAVLATPVNRFGMLERLPRCVHFRPAWNEALVDGLLDEGFDSQWTVRRTARLIEHSTVLVGAIESATAWPVVHGWYMTRALAMEPAAKALQSVDRPHWPGVGALAESLEVSVEGLWRLTRSPQWQRRSPLSQQHYRYQLLPKRSGGWRLLEAPHPYLRELQRKVLDACLARLPPHEAACAYVRGRSVVDHARAHAGQAVLLKFDLQDFFATVRASRVQATFVTLGFSPAVARELARLCTTATPEPVLERLREDGGLTWQQARRLRDSHLPQGAPTSAALANLCAFRLDVRIAGLARSLDARYTRYADDIVISGGPELRRWADRIEARLGGFALDEGFALNHAKTRRVSAGRRQQVANIVVNAHPNLPRDQFDRLKAVLHRCATQGPSSQNQDGVPHWEQHLRGRVAWAAQLNPVKAQRLQRVLATIDWAR